MNKSYVVLVVILIISILLAKEAKADDGNVIVGTAPGVPACQELNELLPWQYQTQLYGLCKEYGIDYCFALAVIEQESHFNPDAFNKGTLDRGLMQVNRQWVSKFIKLGYIESSKDLYDPKKNIQCGMWILADCVMKYGNTERAYVYYNIGPTSVKSTESSRAVMRYWQEWKEKFTK